LRETVLGLGLSSPIAPQPSALDKQGPAWILASFKLQLRGSITQGVYFFLEEKKISNWYVNLGRRMSRSRIARIVVVFLGASPQAPWVRFAEFGVWGFCSLVLVLWLQLKSILCASFLA
jgi:hypothetical protein